MSTPVVESASWIYLRPPRESTTWVQGSVKSAARRGQRGYRFFWGGGQLYTTLTVEESIKCADPALLVQGLYSELKRVAVHCCVKIR